LKSFPDRSTAQKYPKFSPAQTCHLPHQLANSTGKIKDRQVTTPLSSTLPETIFLFKQEFPLSFSQSLKCGQKNKIINRGLQFSQSACRDKQNA
jgi:hypothetical protein